MGKWWTLEYTIDSRPIFRRVRFPPSLQSNVAELVYAVGISRLGGVKIKTLSVFSEVLVITRMRYGTSIAGSSPAVT